LQSSCRPTFVTVAAIALVLHGFYSDFLYLLASNYQEIILLTMKCFSTTTISWLLVLTATLVTRHSPCYANTSLESTWHIGEPALEYNDLKLKLKYTVSASMNTSSMLLFTLYNSAKCSKGGVDVTDNDYLTGYMTTDGDGTTIASDTDATQSIRVDFTINPENITTSDVFRMDNSTDSLTARIEFCIRFSEFTDDPKQAPETALEVNFLETVVTFHVKLDASGIPMEGGGALELLLQKISRKRRRKLTRRIRRRLRRRAHRAAARNHVTQST
jgi:hypothetical protein